MGFLDNFRRRSPELERAIEAEKEKIRAAGDSIQAQIEADKNARMEALNAAHAERMVPLDQKIARTKQDIEDTRKQIFRNQAFRGLQLGLSMSLTSNIARSRDICDPRSALDGIRKEVEGRIDELKANLSAQAITDLETWALAKVGDDERLSGEIRTAFQDFIQELEKQGMSLA